MSVVEYVVGFPVCREKEVVLLCRKHKPTWQAGKLNGFGGMVEEGETPNAAMRREWTEEGDYGEPTPSSPTWRFFCTLWIPDKMTKVYCYSADMPGHELFERHGGYTDVGDEKVMVSLQELYRYPVVPNLRWMIPLALDPDRRGIPQFEMAGT